MYQINELSKLNKTHFPSQQQEHGPSHGEPAPSSPKQNCGAQALPAVANSQLLQSRGSHGSVPMAEEGTANSETVVTTPEHPRNDSDDLDSEEAGESDDESEDEQEGLSGHKCTPPLIPACNSALSDLDDILSPRRLSGFGHNLFQGDDLLWKRLEMMKMFLWNYCKPGPALEHLTWIAASA